MKPATLTPDDLDRLAAAIRAAEEARIRAAPDAVLTETAEALDSDDPERITAALVSLLYGDAPASGHTAREQTA